MSCFYADMVIGKRYWLLDGPFLSETEARAALPAASSLAVEIYPDASFAFFGTCKTVDRGPGRLSLKLRAAA